MRYVLEGLFGAAALVVFIASLMIPVWQLGLYHDPFHWASLLLAFVWAAAWFAIAGAFGSWLGKRDARRW